MVKCSCRMVLIDLPRAVTCYKEEEGTTLTSSVVNSEEFQSLADHEKGMIQCCSGDQSPEY